jgi:glutaredoxin 3
MNKVEIYTRSTCGYCKAAKSFLNDHKIKFKEYAVGEGNNLKVMLTRSSESKTVPQIFWNGKHLGGYDEMIEAFNNKKIIFNEKNTTITSKEVKKDELKKFTLSGCPTCFIVGGSMIFFKVVFIYIKKILSFNPTRKL